MKLLLPIVASVSAVVVASELPSRELSSFDYADLKTWKSSPEFLSTLEKDGIFTIRNIPNYAESRFKLLQSGVECIKQKPLPIGVELEVMNDQSRRSTIKSSSSYQDGATTDFLPSCASSYAQDLQAFSRIIENVVAEFGAAVDEQVNPAYPHDSVAAIVKSGEHIDHFHAYELTQDSTSAPAVKFHTDVGLFIAMTSPEFFTTTDSIQKVKNPDVHSGLIIKDHKGVEYYPHLPPEELVIMIGEGFSKWANFRPEAKFQAVSHKVSLPTKFSQQYVRSWMGKMILLAKDQRIQSLNMTYEEYAVASANHLFEQTKDDFFASSVCPAGAKLVASDRQCVARDCYPVNATNTTRERCMIACNHAPVHKEFCEQNCKCSNALNTRKTTKCWMVCNEELSPQDCPYGYEQRCGADGEGQLLVCIPPPASKDTIESTVPPSSSSSIASLSVLALVFSVVVFSC